MLRAAVDRKFLDEQKRLRQAQEKRRRQNRKRSAGAKETMLKSKKKHSLKKANRKGVVHE